MANEATSELYRRQSGLNKAKFQTDYEQYLADLATKYGVSNDQLNANLEARGILRSGEAGTARTRLSAAEEAARTTARTNYDYNIGNEDINLATRLAGLMAGGSSGGGTPAPVTPPVTPPSETPATVPMYRSPADPAYDDMRNRGPQTPAAPVATVEAPQARTGTADSMERNAPALPDLSGVDWDALARMGTPRPIRDAAPRAPRPVTNMPRPGTGTTTRVNPVSARNR